VQEQHAAYAIKECGSNTHRFFNQAHAREYGLSPIVKYFLCVPKRDWQKTYEIKLLTLRFQSNVVLVYNPEEIVLNPLLVFHKRRSCDNRELRMTPP